MIAAITWIQRTSIALGLWASLPFSPMWPAHVTPVYIDVYSISMYIPFPVESTRSDRNGHIALALQRFNQIHQLFATQIWILAQKPVRASLNRHGCKGKGCSYSVCYCLLLPLKPIEFPNKMVCYTVNMFLICVDLRIPKSERTRTFWLEKDQTKTQFQGATKPCGPHKCVSVCHILTCAYIC